MRKPIRLTNGARILFDSDGNVLYQPPRTNPCKRGRNPRKRARKKQMARGTRKLRQWVRSQTPVNNPPRRRTVKARKTSDTTPTGKPIYELEIRGPGGFMQRFRGTREEIAALRRRAGRTNPRKRRK